MEDYILKAKARKTSPKYGLAIMDALLSSPLSSTDISVIFSISITNSCNILKRMMNAGLIVKKQKGKFTEYSLSEEVKRSYDSIEDNRKKEEAEKEHRSDILHKTLFFNIISGLQSNVYVSYLSKNMEFTFGYFSGTELIMLLFILGIYNFGEGQNFASIFGIDEVSAIEMKKNLLNKFQTFLFEVIQKYNMPLDGTTREQ